MNKKEETEKILKEKEALIETQKIVSKFSSSIFMKLDLKINEFQLIIEKKVLLEDFDENKLIPLINFMEQGFYILKDLIN